MARNGEFEKRGLPEREKERVEFVKISCSSRVFIVRQKIRRQKRKRERGGRGREIERERREHSN